MATIPKNIRDYDNQAVRARFAEYYDIDPREVVEIFEAVKDFLYVSHRYEKETGKRLRIIDETFVIDEMWHNFILFTEDYRAFCEEMLGEFYHHTPAVSRDETITEAELAEQLEFIRQYIGDEKLELWYGIWALKYNAHEMHERKILPEIAFEVA